MTSESRTGFHLRERFSGYKQRAKDKLIQHNVTLFVHRNITSDHSDEHHSHSRFGFRDKMHHMKDVLKNKTHYQEIKDKIKDKIDPHENITYTKGFYDKLFSPETENEIYLQTIVICLWAIALLAIIPTLIVVFIPEKKIVKKKQKLVFSSLNMIFFHIFLCEFCYLFYVLLAMINVAQDFRLASFFCDIANYGMYVTIPIMQFALLFLSLERLSHHCADRATWLKIFKIPFLVQLILIAIWAILISIIMTVRFIRNQFSFNLIRDQVDNFAPPIFGDVLNKFASRPHHCSIDGRLSSIFKTLIIVLFVILIVKPMVVSLSFNFLKCGCCRRNRNGDEPKSSRSTTTLVTLFLVFNVFLSFPFYFVSMFNSVLTRIESTKDTFDLVLKICFILRLLNIICECLAFYIFEGLAWKLVSKCFYYLTCKKCSMFNDAANHGRPRTKDPQVQQNMNEIIEAAKRDEEEAERSASHNDDDDDDGGPVSSKNDRKKKSPPVRDQEKKPLLPDGPLKRKNTLPDSEDEDHDNQQEDKEETETDNEDETEDEETSKKVAEPESTQEKSEDETDEDRETKKLQRQNSRSQVVEPKTNGTIEKSHRRSHRRAPENDHSKTRERSHRRAPENDPNNSKERSHRRVPESDQSKPRERSHRRALENDHSKTRERSHRRAPESEQTKTHERSHRRPRPKPAENTVNEVNETFRRDSQAQTTERTSRREHRRKTLEPTTTVTSTNETTQRHDRKQTHRTGGERRERTRERRSSVSSAHEDASKTVSQKVPTTKANGQTRSRSPAASATNPKNAHRSVSPRPKKPKKKSKVPHKEKIMSMSDAV